MTRDWPRQVSRRTHLLVGDAAHIHPPTGGQGLNTSVQDAHGLGWKLSSVLAGADDSCSTLNEEERRPIAAGVLGSLATRLLDAHKQGEMRRTLRDPGSWIGPTPSRR